MPAGREVCFQQACLTCRIAKVSAKDGKRNSQTHVQGVLAKDNDFSLCYLAESDANIVFWTKMSLIALVMTLMRLIREGIDDRDRLGQQRVMLPYGFDTTGLTEKFSI